MINILPLMSAIPLLSPVILPLSPAILPLSPVILPLSPVIPATAGIQLLLPPTAPRSWAPPSAGVTDVQKSAKEVN